MVKTVTFVSIKILIIFKHANYYLWTMDSGLMKIKTNQANIFTQRPT